MIGEIQRGMCGFNVRFHQSPKTADRRFTQWEGRFSAEPVWAIAITPSSEKSEKPSLYSNDRALRPPHRDVARSCIQGFDFSASLMSAMMASAGATRVATAARAVNSAKRTTSARAVSAASTGKRAAAAGRSAQFFQGDRNPSVELRQRHVSATVSHRSMAKRTVTASATPVPAVQSAAPTEWKGAKLKPLGFSVLAGLIIWCIPAPEGVSAQAWHLLAVFVGTIVGIITNVRPCSLAPLLRPKHLSSKPSVLLTPGPRSTL